MKIEDDELARLQDVATKAYVQKNFDAAKTLLVAIAPIVAALREAQELIEKFDLSWTVDADSEIGGCIYCHICLIKDDCILCQSLGGAHRTDCPYAIRERMGYGGQD